MKVEYHWRCMKCPEHGSGEGSDKAAEKHGKATLHPTASWATPLTLDVPTTDEREG